MLALVKSACYNFYKLDKRSLIMAAFETFFVVTCIAVLAQFFFPVNKDIEDM